jgi:hypothetical protein
MHYSGQMDARRGGGAFMRESIKHIFFICLFLLVSHSALAQQEAGTVAGGSKHAAPHPTFSPSPGTYIGTQLVTLTDALAGAAIYYTTNGKTPNTSSPLYTQPISVTSTTTIKAIAVASGYLPSSVASGKYVLEAAPQPKFSPLPGTYIGTQLVTLTDAVAGAAIHYTTNGKTPNTSSPLYTQPISVTSTTTIKAIAVASGYSQSAVSSGKYVIKPQTATPSFSPPPGNYSAAQSVTLTDATGGAAIYYTTDGSTPTTHSLLYKGVAIQVAKTTTIKAMAVTAHAEPSAVAVGLYTITQASPLDLRAMAQQGIIVGLATQTFLTQLSLYLDVLLNKYLPSSWGLPASGACGDPTGSLLSNLEGQRASSIMTTVPANRSSPGYGAIYYDNNCTQPWLNAELDDWTISSGSNTYNIATNETLNFYDTSGSALGEMTLNEAAVVTKSYDPEQDLTDITVADNGLGSFTPAGGGSPVQLGLACSFGTFETVYNGDPVTGYGAVAQDFTSLGFSVGVVVPFNIVPAISPGLAWSGTQLVAVSAAGSIFTSSNGTAWASSPSGTTSNLRSVTWSGSQFVAVGSSGTILTSPNGVTWTSRTSRTTASMAAVVWSGTQFVAVGSSGTILTSPNGVNWTVQSSGTTAALEGVAWSGTKLVAVGLYEILISADGKTWAPYYPGNSKLFGVTWSGGQFVVVGDVILTSTDGNTWVNSTPQGFNGSFLGVTGSGSEFVAVGLGGVIFTSTDGQVWTAQTSGTTLGLRAATWTGNQFVAVGYANVVLTSPNGSSWTVQTSAPGYGEVVYFVSSGSSVVSGALGSLTVTAPTAQTLEITGGTPYGGAAFSGFIGGLSIFPPTPTGWTVTDETHDLKCQVTLVDNTTRNLTGNITSISTGETLGTVALDRSGTGTVTFSGGAAVTVTNWLQTD